MPLVFYWFFQAIMIFQQVSIVNNINSLIFPGKLPNSQCGDESEDNQGKYSDRSYYNRINSSVRRVVVAIAVVVLRMGMSIFHQSKERQWVNDFYDLFPLLWIQVNSRVGSIKIRKKDVTSIIQA